VNLPGCKITNVNVLAGYLAMKVPRGIQGLSPGWALGSGTVSVSKEIIYVESEFRLPLSWTLVWLLCS